MRTIDRPYARWLEFVADVLSRPTITLVHDQVAEQIRNTFDCLGVAFNWPTTSGMPGLKIWPDRFMSMAQLATPAIYALNPLRNYYLATGDPTARSLTEVPSRIATVRALAAWREFSVPWGVYHQLALPLDADGPAHRAYVLARPAGAFTSGELDLARSLQPVLAAVDGQTAVLRRLQARSPARNAGPFGDPGLTGRELAVLTLLADGLTAATIGRRLAIAPRTVTKHLERVYVKLHVRNRVAAIAVAQHAGLLPTPSEAR